MVRISNKDLRIVSAQIGKFPQNLLEISLKCSFGFPMVIKSKPILNGKPFPTIYWLTCPYLRYRISQLEAEGKIPEYEKVLSSSSKIYDRQLKAHIMAREEALKMLKKSNLKWVKERIKNAGMGGIVDFSHIKCLHLHVAYHLGGIKNPVAEMALNEIITLECSNAMCKKYEEVS